MENINEYLNAIIRISYDNLPVEDGWKDFTVNAFCLTKFVQINASYIDSEGKQIPFNPKYASPADKSEDLTFLFMDLRKAMYDAAPDKGAWYTAKITVDSEGKFKTNFDYDNKPAFKYEPSADKFAHDLETFPREEGLVPAWLKDIVKA